MHWPEAWLARRRADEVVVAPPLESEIQRAGLELLHAHPSVAWAARMNVVAYKIGGRFIKAGFKGLSDTIGQMKDGRFLAVEFKREGEYPTKEQRQFLDTVNKSGGVAFVARSVDDVLAGLRAASSVP